LPAGGEEEVFIGFRVIGVFTLLTRISIKSVILGIFTQKLVGYFFSLRMAILAAARRATGIRKGLQLT
jgi:hypothetical protein